MVHVILASLVVLLLLLRVLDVEGWITGELERLLD
jgi:hypothetical protein